MSVSLIRNTDRPLMGTRAETVQRTDGESFVIFTDPDGVVTVAWPNEELKRWAPGGAYFLTHLTPDMLRPPTTEGTTMTTRTPTETETLIKAGIIPRITPADAGTWLMGSLAAINPVRVVTRAEEYGFTVPVEYAEDLRRADEDDYDGLSEDDALTAWEAVHGQGGLSDMATDYLNGLAPEGWVFEWSMGELSLIREEDADSL